MLAACIDNWFCSIARADSNTRTVHRQGSEAGVRSQWLLSNSYLYGAAKPRFPRPSSTGASDSLSVCPLPLPYNLGSTTSLTTAWTRYGLSPSLDSHSGSAGQQAFFLVFSRPLDALSTWFVRRLSVSSSVGLSQRVGFVTLFAVVRVAPGPDAFSLILPWLPS
jgi:hypothetical protein